MEFFVDLLWTNFGTFYDLSGPFWDLFRSIIKQNIATKYTKKDPKTTKTWHIFFAFIHKRLGTLLILNKISVSSSEFHFPLPSFDVGFLLQKMLLSREIRHTCTYKRRSQPDLIFCCSNIRHCAEFLLWRKLLKWDKNGK